MGGGAFSLDSRPMLADDEYVADFPSRGFPMTGSFRWTSLLLLLSPLVAGAQEIDAILKNGVHDLKNEVVRVPLQWPAKHSASNPVACTVNGKKLVGQLVEPSFANEAIKANEGSIRKDLLVIVPEVKANETLKVVVDPKSNDKSAIAGGFSWKDVPGDHSEASFTASDGKSIPVLRYMCKTYDTSSPDARNKTYKVFHHVYDPAGTRYVTNGGHTDPHASDKDLLYPHHRGLYFAFNKITYDGKTADIWHCTNGTHSAHNKTIFETGGPIAADQRVLIDWVGQKGDVFAQEERQMTVYKVPGGTLVEFATRLKPLVDKVKLDGDPQHSGFHFRAANEVSKTNKQTYYLRPDGKGAMGNTRNWDPKNKGPINLPWDVMSFVLGGKRYSVEYIDSPSNPGEKRYSERDYGRFGCYFEYTLTPEHPLLLNHRIWLQDGEMSADQAVALREGFIDGPKVQ